MLARILSAVFALGVFATSFASPQADSSDALPEVDGRAVVSRVNGEPIYLDDLIWSLANMHAEMGDSDRITDARSPDQSLQRLIDVELVSQESRTIGLDTLPEFRETQDSQRTRFLREAVLQQEVPTVPPPSEADVERAYRMTLLRVRMLGLMLDTEDNAKSFRAKVVDGSNFLALARAEPDFLEHQLIPSDGWMSLSSLYPAVAEVLADAEPGATTDVIEVPGEGWAVIHLFETELPDDPAEREASRARIAASDRKNARRSYKQALADRYATVDEDAVEALDFQAEGIPFETFLDDRTPLARFENTDPVTVADLASGLQAQFFHGAIKAAARGELSAKKRLVFDELVERKSLGLEAIRLGIDQSVEFRSQMRYFESIALFGMFVEQVITRDLRAYREDLERTYEKHRDRLATPGRVQLAQLVFVSRSAAEAALARLRNGADFEWVRTNTPGVVAGEALDEYWKFPSRTIEEDTLPEEIRESLEGATESDYRLAAEGEGAFHVLKVVERTPPYVPSFEEIGSKLGPLALGEMRDQALRDYIALLRDSSEIEVFAEGDRLRSEVMDSLGRTEEQ